MSFVLFCLATTVAFFVWTSLCRKVVCPAEVGISKTFAGFVSLIARLFVIALLTIPASYLTLGQTPAKQADRANLQGKVERELIKLEHEWADAVVRGDIAVLDRIEADDLIVTDPDGKVSNKAQNLADIKSGAFKVESIKLDDMQVHAYWDTAVVTGRTTMTGQYKGKDISGQYRWTDVFVKRQRRRQVVATHASQIVR